MIMSKWCGHNRYRGQNTVQCLTKCSSASLVFWSYNESREKDSTNPAVSVILGSNRCLAVSSYMMDFNWLMWSNRSLSISDGRVVDLNLFFLVAAGTAGVAHRGHNSAHSIVTNPVTFIH